LERDVEVVKENLGVSLLDLEPKLNPEPKLDDVVDCGIAEDENEDNGVEEPNENAVGACFAIGGAVAAGAADAGVVVVVLILGEEPNVNFPFDEPSSAGDTALTGSELDSCFTFI